METIKVKKKAGRISPTLMGDYDDTTTYRRLDWVYYGGTSYICKKNNTIGIKPSTLERWQKIIELPTELNMIFEEATTRENISSGEKLSVILGKIKKCISDIKTVAFTGSYNDLSDTPKSLKNPNALNINFNGTSKASYDGSVTKEVNVTPAAINAVNTSAVLTTKEQISANTNAANVTGALAAKAIMADITQINGSLSAVNSKLENFDANSVGKCYFRKITTQVPATAEETLIATLHADWSCPAIIGALMRRPDGTGYNTIDASTLNFRVTANLIYAEFTGNSWWHGTELILYLTVGALNG